MELERSDLEQEWDLRERLKQKERKLKKASSRYTGDNGLENDKGSGSGSGSGGPQEPKDMLLL